MVMAMGNTPEAFQDAPRNNSAPSRPLAEVDNSLTIPNASLMQEPNVNDRDPYSALSYLFQVAVNDSDAVELCHAIKMPMTPPVEQGVITYLLRLEAIGQLDKWPRLFGQGNAFIVYLLDKVANNRFLASERDVYEERRRDVMIWRASQT